MKTTMKRIFSLLIVLVMVCGMLPVVASAAEEKTLSFATTASRTSLSTSQQVWEANGITFTNDKASSTSNVADYSNPVRCYKSSTVTIACTGMTQIVLNCYSSSYLGGFSTSGNVTVSGSTVTVTFTEATDSYTHTVSGSQLRINSIVVTVAGGCDHVYTEEITTDATCTEDGEKTFTCSACGDTYTEVIPATGHNYVDGVCANCGNEQYSISFSVNGTVSETILYVSGGITMPEGNDSGDYTFSGWTNAAITEEGTTAPGVIYAAGQTVEFDAATTLYALYTRSEGSTATEYVETALSDIGTADVFVIVGTNATASYALTSANGSSNAPAVVTVTAADGKLSDTPADTILWTLSKSGDSYTFYPNGDTTKWLYCNASNNGVRVGTGDAKTFVLDASGYLKNETQSRYLGIYNNQDWRCYTTNTGTSNIANQTFTFYAKPNATIYYTTSVAGCTHQYEESVTTAATCTEAGVMTYTCGLCGDTYTEEIPATGHDFSKGDCACGEADPIKTIPEANELGLAGTTTEKYTVEGTVTEIVNTTYGNMYIEDADGNTLYIYGMYSADGSTRFDAMETKPVVGDQIKVYGVLGSYNSVAQMKNAWLIHIHNYESVVTDATCESAGYTTHTCADCGKSYVSDVTDFGHQLDEGTVTTEATCENEGVMTYNCTACEAVVTEAIPMLPHTPNGEGYVTTAATCTTDGVMTYDSCDVCGEGYTEVIPATGHNYVDGQCTVCGYYEPDTLLTIPEANAFGLTYASSTYTPDKFYVEGIIYNVYQPTYGNMYIRDAQGNEFTIYGLYSADGTVRYDAMDVKPVAGDYVKVYGNVGQFNGTAQIKNGWLAAHCTHKDAEGNSLYTGVETTAPDCENDGVMTYTCQCGHSYTEAIPAIGHNYVLGEDGVTYTCENCGDSYSAFSVSFSVPEGITPVEEMTYTNGIVLPEAESSGEYTFIGWTDVQLAAADKVETAPTIYPANETFYTNEACTLYALYAYDTVGGFSGYQLADSADSLYDGAQIIIVGAVAKDDVFYAMSTEQKTNNRGTVAVTKDGDKIAELADTVQVLTLQKDADTGYWALYTGAGYLYAASSEKNYLRTQTTNDANGLWTIEINSECVATVVAQGTNTRATMQYNNSSTSNLFACYSSASQKALNIFVKQNGTVTYYSTDLGCEHNYEGEVTTPAGCETEGVMTYTCSLCGESYTEAIDPIGHAWDEGTVTTPATCTTTGVKTYTCGNCGGTKEETVAKIAHDFANGDCVCGHPAPDSLITIAQANQWGLTYDKNTYSTGKYYIEGTIESIANATYGNLYIQDEEGNKFYIYGLYSADGSTRYDAMDPQPAVGETIKVYTVIGTYNGTEAQGKNAWLVEDVDYVDSYNVELTDKIGMNFVLTDDVTSATVTFNGETTTVDLASLPTNENGLRVYNLKMAAAQMTEEVTWLFNGQTEVSYTVRGYADVVLAGEYGANVKALVRAMLHYGAAAQNCFGYNTGNFADADMTDTVTNAIQAAEMAPTTGETAGIVHYGSTLVYRDRVAVRVYFKLTGDAAIDTFTFTANGEAVEAQEGSNGLYYVEIADIAPQNLDDAVTVTVNDGLTVTYSPLNYIYRMAGKTTDTALQTLLQQLYDYYVAAEYLVANGPDDFETDPDVVG